MPPRRQAAPTNNAPVTRTRSTRSAVAAEPPEPQIRTRHVVQSTSEALAARMASRLKISDDKGKEREREGETATDVRTSRVPSRSRAKPAQKVEDEGVEGLADMVERKLVIEDRKVLTSRAKSKSKEETCTEAMLAVNAASKKLSAIIQTGWRSSESSNSPKANSKKHEGIVSEVEAQAMAIREGLATLREHRPGNVDVERAACSAVGKLVSLESYQSALPILRDMSTALPSYYPHSPSETPLLDTLLDLPFLPLPSLSISSNDETLLNLLSSFLLYSLITSAYTLFTQLGSFDSPSTASQSLHDFAHYLHHSRATLLQWLPILQQNITSTSTKHLDGTLTRAYTALVKASSLPPSPSTACTLEQSTDIFRIRLYALLLLTGTSSGTIKSNTFWEQCVKFSAAYVKSVFSANSKHASNSDSESEAKRQVTQVILDAFDVIFRHSEKRADTGEWMKGEGFVTWCEYWMDFAKRVGNPETVKKISRLIKSTTSSPHERSAAAEGASGSNSSRPGINTLQAANICATLAQTTAHLDQPDSSELDETAMQESLKAISQSEAYLSAAFGSSDGDASLEKAGTKVWRALERLRRVALKVFESEKTSSSRSQPGTAETLTRKITDVLLNVLASTETGHADLLTSTLDSLFSLAKSTLNPAKPHSIDSSFQFLHQGLTLANVSPDSLPPLERANFLRCISGAFHTLGATLYQAGHHSHAVRFFEKSCSVGEGALHVYATATGESDKSEEKEGQWRTLEEQVYRRWEILGVCYSKTGDRKAAYEAFRNCITAYPFHSSSGATPTFLERAGACSPITLWDGSPSAKHIASVVDRMTYTGVCDLLLPIEEVTLKSWSPRLPNGINKDLDKFSIVGALLERQVESLESSKWKPAIQSAMGKLLQDAMKVYGRQKMPIRKARVIIKCLELASSVNGKGPCIVDDIEDYALEADGLLQVTDLGQDTGLAGLCAQYRAALKLRLAHLMHQQMPTSQSSNSRIVAYVEGACSILKGILSPLPRQSLAGPSSPLASKGRGTRRATGKRQATVSKATSTRTRGRTAKVASALPVTPKAKPRKSTSAMPQSPLPRLSFGVPSTLECAPVLLDLLQSTAHLVGLLGDIVKKVQVLAIGRRISEQYLESRPDDYIKFSTEVAHEYVNLGKTSKAASIYAHTWNAMNNNLRVSDESRVLFLLRYSESLISLGNVLKSSTSYTEAYGIAQAIDVDEKSLPSAQRVLTRAALLERAAVAATTFSLIQYTRDDPVASINGLLQSLRLWNRAFDTLSRLAPPSPSKDPSEDNPFLQTESKPVSPSTDNSLFLKLPGMSGIGWRIAEGLLNTLFSLTRAYVSRGSPREAEFFAQQAKDLSISLNMPAMVSRAFSRLGEIYLHLGQLDDSHTCLVEAAKLVSDAGGPDAAEIRRLRAEHSRVNENKKDARQLYDEAIIMLEELEQQFTIIDGHVVGKSMELSSKAPTTSANETLAPSLLLSILRQNIVMLHAEGGEYQRLLERLRSLPPTAEIKAEESALMAKLKLGDVYGRFQADMFLSSLAESAITLPMGMKRQKNSVSASTQEILSILNQAEKLFWSDLALVAKRGNVFHVRDAAVSLALIKAFQDTLGKTGSDGPTLAASLLDHSTAITLRREVLEVVQYKFGDPNDHNDLQWPLVTPSGSPMSPPKHRKRARFVSFDFDDEELPTETKQSMLAKYWQTLAQKYQEQPYDSLNLAKPREIPLPANWTVVSISVTEDKNTMFVTRQCANRDPLIFYIPLKERRDSEDEEYLGFDDALAELREIIHLSDEGTKEAANVKSREARAAWWANRSALDTRMKQLLDNIEFCWLGAFKTILSSPKHIPREALDDLRTRLESIFDQSIVIRDRKQAISISLDESLMECFANLSPKVRDEELEDLVYFILDLYQFHGFPIATAELDIDQVVIDFRSALEDHAAKYRGRIIPLPDSHMFLVLDKNVQGIPWESIPILRGQSVSRIPSMDFLLDRLRYAKNVRGQSDMPIDRLVVNPRETFFVLNPSGDLKNTEGRFVDWLQDMKQVGWSGIVGKVPSELQFADALIKKDLLIYFGHGGAEQYIRSRKVRHLPRCAATMLWGCSSGELKEMGDFDRAGTPYNYMLAGCPTLVANLWDVTDRDIDKFSQSVFDKMHLTPDAVSAWNLHTAGDQDRTSIVTAVAESRDACKLKYLTGAAPIIYGIPFYL